MNGDGFDDLLIGTPGFAAGTPAAYLVYGGNFEVEEMKIGTSGVNVLNGTSGANNMVGGQGDDVVNGNGGADVLNGGQGNDQMHVTDDDFFRIDGGTGEDTVHFDYAGTIDFGNLDGKASTSDRGRLSNVEVLDVDNGQANGLILHLSDILDLDVTVSDVGGNPSLDNARRRSTAMPATRCGCSSSMVGVQPIRHRSPATRCTVIKR